MSPIPVRSEETNRPVWRALDGLRGIAVLVVVLYHLETPGWFPFDRGGWLGVELFFVLSGFLITWLLVGEFRASETVSFRNFYSRRFLRLMPAQWALVGFVAVFAVTVAPAEDRSALLSGVPSSLLYFSNWVKAFDWWPQMALTHTWSLSIEEQYYLLWPPVALLALRRGGASLLWKVVVAGALLGFLVRTGLYVGGASQARMYNGTDSRALGIMIGSAIGVAVGMGFLRRVRAAEPVAIAGVCLFGLLCVLVGQTRLSVGLGLTAIDAVIAVALIASLFVADDSLFLRVMEFPPLAMIGRVSFGLYLWHKTVIVLFDGGLYGLSWWQEAMVETVLFSCATYLSWRFIEKPLSRRRRQYASAVSFGPT